MIYIIYALGFLAFLSLLVYVAFKFEEWTEREADRQEKERMDLQRALLKANYKHGSKKHYPKGSEFIKKWVE